MKVRYQTKAGNSFTERELNMMKQVQKNPNTRQALFDWALSQPETQKAMNDDLVAKYKEYTNKYVEIYDTLIVYALTHMEKDRWGRIRVFRFFRLIKKLKKEFLDFYGSSDKLEFLKDCDIYAMQKELKERNMDPETIEREVFLND